MSAEKKSVDRSTSTVLDRWWPWEERQRWGGCFTSAKGTRCIHGGRALLFHISGGTCLFVFANTACDSARPRCIYSCKRWCCVSETYHIFVRETRVLGTTWVDESSSVLYEIRMCDSFGFSNRLHFLHAQVHNTVARAGSLLHHVRRPSPIPSFARL